MSPSDPIEPEPWATARPILSAAHSSAADIAAPHALVLLFCTAQDRENGAKRGEGSVHVRKIEVIIPLAWQVALLT